MTSKPVRLTQRHIAELAGVSQAIVSLVVSGRTDATTRVSEPTRRRVLRVIEETGYSVDPAARMLAGRSNALIGVFTYESAFPRESSDFYAPLLRGVESAAEALGQDLLLFTSSRTQDGRRRLLHEGSRLRMADGCVLLGREMNGGELSALVDRGFPFVAVGRRDGDERIPYVGAAYCATVTELVTLAIERGHRRFGYVRLPYDSESTRDRLESFRSAVDQAGAEAVITASAPKNPDGVLDELAASDVTVVFVEDPEEASGIARSNRSADRPLSLVALGESDSQHNEATPITHLSAPRAEIGAQAVRMLTSILSGDDVPRRVLLPCAIVYPDATLGRAAT
ncbi:LacI family DNA-binding transcriptional regulator [Microbacterium sp. Mu-80]|uniref:LacI family DNA-binding transcriptional regulator n=1 Tax=Microbacterium bandirmense TaxID=3122050 RepID=A0ABU8LCM9_9MICO